MTSCLNILILATFTRSEIFDREEIERTVFELLESKIIDKDDATREDLARFLILTRVRRILKPIDLNDDEKPSSDSPEARIMQSDLLSGGLETHEFHIFEEASLKGMLEDAKYGQDENLILLLEQALSKNLGA